jgi:hypothetical protein
VLANQLRQVNRLADFVSTSDKVNDVDREAVAGAVQADLDALTALRDALADNATHRDVVNALHHGILIRAVARTQVTVAVKANIVRDAAATPTDPTTTGTATDPTGADTQTSAADDAVATVVALAPDSTRAEINEARHSAMAELGDAEQPAEDDSADGSTGDTDTGDTGTGDDTTDSGTTSPTP